MTSAHYPPSLTSDDHENTNQQRKYFNQPMAFYALKFPFLYLMFVEIHIAFKSGRSQNLLHFISFNIRHEFGYLRIKGSSTGIFFRSQVRLLSSHYIDRLFRSKMASPVLILLAILFSIFTNGASQSSGNHCGIDYTHALDCHQACPSGFASECPAGETCFSSVSCQVQNPTNWCGTSYHNAQSCIKACPFGTISECPSGLSCFSGINVCGGPSTTSPIGTAPPTSSQQYNGFYLWTWNPTPGFSDATISVAFSGWVDTNNAISDSMNVYNFLVGEKYISFGGGNENGRWSLSGISGVNQAIISGRISDFTGICYDIEEGDQGLGQAFKDSFALAKASNLKVLVTVSHSSPYGFLDANNVMEAIISSREVDFLSPQLYTSGLETTNDYTISNGYGWENYSRSSAKILLSIPRANMYADGEQFFSSIGVSTAGFIQWRNAL